MEKDEKAKDILIFNTGNQVLRKMKHCTTWSYFVDDFLLYVFTFLQFLFYTFKFDSAKSIDINVDDFLKIVVEMGSLSVSVTDEIQAIVFLSSLPTRYG